MHEIFNMDFYLQVLLIPLSIVGMILVNKKKTSNYYFFIVGYIIWGTIYFYHGLYGAVLRDAIFLCLNIHGLILWRRDDKLK